MRYLLTIVFIFAAATLPTSANEVITITTIGPQKQNDASHDYFVSLLSLALNENGDNKSYQIKTLPHAGQARVVKLIEQGLYYDVIWSGYSAERSKNLVRVAFPLFLGGLGIRGAIIRKSDTTFASLNTIEKLREKIICQGLNWPDAKILQLAKLNVVEVSHFDAMLEMVSLERCDLLPLSIFEGQSELNAVQALYPKLTFSSDVLLSYYLEMNFYLNKNNQALADKINAGLEKIAQNGELLSFMKNHSLTQNAFPLSKYINSTIINIESDVMPNSHAIFYKRLLN